MNFMIKRYVTKTAVTRFYGKREKKL